MEREKTFTVTKDIYNAVGILLLKSGTTITMNEQMEHKMKKYGVYSEVIKQMEEAEERKIEESIQRIEPIEPMKALDSIHSSAELIKRINVRADKFIRASLALDHFIQKGRREPWYIYLRLLYNTFPWFYSHAINVALLSILLYGELDGELPVKEELILAALLHDIGVVLIPEEIIHAIINGQGDADISTYERHCELGAKMLENIPFPSQSRQMILEHHERLDGSGYPLKKNKEKLLEGSKILILANEIEYASYHQQDMERILGCISQEACPYDTKHLEALTRILITK